MIERGDEGRKRKESTHVSVLVARCFRGRDEVSLLFVSAVFLPLGRNAVGSVGDRVGGGDEGVGGQEGVHAFLDAVAHGVEGVGPVAAGVGVEDEFAGAGLEQRRLDGGRVIGGVEHLRKGEVVRQALLDPPERRQDLGHHGVLESCESRVDRRQLVPGVDDHHLRRRTFVSNFFRTLPLGLVRVKHGPGRRRGPFAQDVVDFVAFVVRVRVRASSGWSLHFRGDVNRRREARQHRRLRGEPRSDGEPPVALAVRADLDAVPEHGADDRNRRRHRLRGVALVPLRRRHRFQEFLLREHFRARIIGRPRRQRHELQRERLLRRRRRSAASLHPKFDEVFRLRRRVLEEKNSRVRLLALRVSLIGRLRRRHREAHAHQRVSRSRILGMPVRVAALLLLQQRVAPRHHRLPRQQIRQLLLLLQHRRHAISCSRGLLLPRLCSFFRLRRG
mmetsp:Transcript_10455/g.31539  ORF Transcript_10455/g.31539 Transcript_10455/m.31539 type:complete len:446 (-) Transcript_10455:7-1344(-)